jgi:hypothetical protein
MIIYPDKFMTRQFGGASQNSPISIIFSIRARWIIAKVNRDNNMIITAIDDCSRWRVLEIYKRRTANNTLQFLDVLMEQFPFAIQRIQTDRGLEFFAKKVQQKLMSLSIKFRPNYPESPHLNGKVERSQKTDLEEFYAVTGLSDFEKLKEQLSEWQFFYNWQRPHRSLASKTPSQIVGDLGEKALLNEAVLTNYDIKNVRIQIANYQHNLAIRKLKGSL